VPTVLIVDDNEQHLKLARDVLQQAGFRTLEARSGASGISLALGHLRRLVPRSRVRRLSAEADRRRRAAGPGPRVLRAPLA
jgi:CheY-like chemotaxis protein